MLAFELPSPSHSEPTAPPEPDDAYACHSNKIFQANRSSRRLPSQTVSRWQSRSSKAHFTSSLKISIERLNKELKRRCKVVGIFPTETALIRLAGAVLLDTHEEWLATDRRYFSEASMAKLYPERDDGDAAVGELERVPAD